MQPATRKKVITVVILIFILFGGYFTYQHIMYVATDDAYVQAHTAMLSSRVAAVVEKVSVDENQKVKTGDLLVQLDDKDYVSKAAQAEAQVASLTVHAAEAQRNFQRISNLFKRDAVSQQQFDDTQANFKEASEQLKSAVALSDQARLNLGYTKVLAPSNGVIAKKNVEVGTFVPVGQPLIGFVQSDERWILANFKETELSEIHKGSKANIEVDAIPHRNFEGEVESLSPSTGATFALLPPDNATGNFTKVVQRVPVKIKLINLSTEDIDKLQAGLSAVVTINKR